jgi:hypothetical protein
MLARVRVLVQLHTCGVLAVRARVLVRLRPEYALLLRLLATSVAAATAGDGDAGDGAMGAMMVAMLLLPMEMAMPSPA